MFENRKRTTRIEFLLSLVLTAHSHLTICFAISTNIKSSILIVRFNIVQSQTAKLINKTVK